MAQETQSVLPTENESWEQKFINSDIFLSDWFDGVAEALDLFLVGNKQVTKRENETSVKLVGAIYYTEGAGPQYSTNLVGNLRLPNDV